MAIHLYRVVIVPLQRTDEHDYRRDAEPVSLAALPADVTGYPLGAGAGRRRRDPWPVINPPHIDPNGAQL